VTTDEESLREKLVAFVDDIIDQMIKSAFRLVRRTADSQNFGGPQRRHSVSVRVITTADALVHGFGFTDVL
jgi:hypothetical protein